MSRLLYALVVCGLLERREGGFANSLEAANFLVKGLPGYARGNARVARSACGAPISRRRHRCRSGSEPAALHRFLPGVGRAHGGRCCAGCRPSADAPPAVALLPALRLFSLSVGSVDVGGGSGGIRRDALSWAPGLKAILFDLPRTAALAAPILRETPGGELVSIEAGDILAGPPSGTHDAVVLRALVQVLAPADATRAIANAAAALRPGGTIYIVGGGVLDDDRMGPRTAVFLNLTFLNLYPAGASYTRAEHAKWLEAARCADVQRITLPSGAGIIHATRKAPADP